jgi:hypothetical protein
LHVEEEKYVMRYRKRRGVKLSFWGQSGSSELCQVLLEKIGDCVNLFPEKYV